MSASPAASPRASPAPEEPTRDEKPTNYSQFFGGDESDLSDDDEGEVPKRAAGAAEGSAAPATRSASPDAGGTAREGSADEEDEEDSEHDAGEDAYVPGTADKPAKIPKFKKKKRSADDEDEDEEGGVGGDEDEEADQEKKRKKKRRKEKREKHESRRRDHAEEDEEEAAAAQPVDEDERRRKEIENRIDNIGKKAAKPTRRRKKGEEDAVDTYHDAVCERLRARMIDAAEKDRRSNEAKMPATAKLALLDEVMSILRNAPLWQSIIDAGVLEAVRAWLEPSYPSGALPAVGIQNAMFEILPKMDLDTTTLKESRLGPIVLFYTKTKRVTPAINRQADALVQAWSRPIIKRPANFRSKHFDSVNEIEMRAGESSQRSRDGGAGGDDDMEGIEETQQSVALPSRKNKRFDARAAAKANEGRKGAMRPIPKEVQYTIAPESRTSHRSENQEHTAKLQLDNRKFNKFIRQMRPANKTK